MTNTDIARRLREQATEMARGGENLYRVRAFRQAALAVQGLPNEAAAVVAAGGTRALERVPGIGKSLAGTIAGLAFGSVSASVSVR
ncbi:MAG: hypothetical protein K2X82_27530 [Gemmataceae bacterium]|nr:hypothetical protein [Gemmataceae bacterium]